MIFLTNSIISLAHWRFTGLHGQINAQLTRTQAIYEGESHKRSVLIIVLSPLLFLAPQKYLTELEEGWVDERILEPVWKSLMIKMLGEWSDIILWVSIHPISGFIDILIVIIVNSYAFSQCRLSCHT